MDSEELIANVRAASEAIEKEIAAKKEELLALSKGKFGEATRALFEMFPELKSFGWKQYTDYFNDGDECTFSAYLDASSLIINGHEEEYGKSKTAPDNLFAGYHKKHYRNSGYVENPAYNPRHELVISTVARVLEAFNEDTLKDMFGDHMLITVTAEGVSTDDYSDHH